MAENTFLDVLTLRSFVREEHGLTFPYTDYVLEIPLPAFPVPDFIMTDCEPGEIVGGAIEFLKPYLIRAAEKNGPEASLGAYVAVDGASVYLAFKQIYLGGAEYTAMTDLAAVGPEKAGGEGMARIAALVGEYVRLLADGVVAAQALGYDWMPAEFKAFAHFYDDAATADWADCLWFAYDHGEAMEAWLAAQTFQGRAAWCKHPCNNALVVRFESEADAKTFELRWSPAQGRG